MDTISTKEMAEAIGRFGGTLSHEMEVAMMKSLARAGGKGNLEGVVGLGNRLSSLLVEGKEFPELDLEIFKDPYYCVRLP